MHSYRIQLIAVRVIRAARELDLPIVALRSRDEANALHARMTDEVVVFDGEESGGSGRVCVRRAGRPRSPGGRWERVRDPLWRTTGRRSPGPQWRRRRAGWCRPWSG
ncbi:biotin carboxylase N-terminal domain-containing protein [Streptomyces sp. NPDC101116]|uniref:biotin carboxylase N-terminal domain-containing protein n=1 Tax=Streptomyces sp. NPDC101116 TaxID=3366107 RepID=UPI0037F59F26